MPDDAMLKMETGTSATTRAGGKPLSWRACAPVRLRHLVPDVSLRTGRGIAILGAVFLVGIATTIGAIGMAAGPDSAALLATNLISICRTSFVQPREDAAFVAENRAAMTTMMAGMDIRPSGDVDRDFVEMMVPHHQGAIDMAATVLRYGRNEKIRRIVQEIIVTQQQEIAVMRLAVGEALPPSIASPTSPFAASSH